MERIHETWDGTNPRVVGPDTEDEQVALVRFKSNYTYMFGPPNDEAFAGHPLASRGLRPNGAYEVVHSSWIRVLERMNSVHQYHRAESFWSRRHIILSFHDSTFECVCSDFDVRTAVGSMRSIVPHAVALLEWRAG